MKEAAKDGDRGYMAVMDGLEFVSLAVLGGVLLLGEAQAKQRFSIFPLCLLSVVLGTPHREHEIRVGLQGLVARGPVRGEVVLAPEPVVIDAGAVRDAGIETGQETAPLASCQSLSRPTATPP
jgi:hypothetical protein